MRLEPTQATGLCVLSFSVGKRNLQVKIKLNSTCFINHSPQSDVFFCNSAFHLLEKWFTSSVTYRKHQITPQS